MPLSHRDSFQLAAFHAFYRAARIGGFGQEEALLHGIVKSSDDEVEKVLANDPNAMQRWLAFVPPKPTKT